MEGTDQRFTQPNFNRGIGLTVIRPSLAEFFGVFFLTFGLYSSSVLMGTAGVPLSLIVVVFLYIGIYSITRLIR
jgi:hypothetical protein